MFKYKYKYKCYIYKTWEKFTQNKKIIIINSYYLWYYKFPKALLDLLMYDLVSGKKGNECDNNNIIRSLLLLVFPNIERIIWYTTDSVNGNREYPFLFSSFFDIFWGDILFKHKSLKSIQIKGTHDVWGAGDHSWIFSEFGLYNKELNQLNQTQFKIYLKHDTENSFGFKEDTLCIDRL